MPIIDMLLVLTGVDLPSFPPPQILETFGTIWRLETILIVTTVSGVDTLSTKLVEARGQAVHPTMRRTAGFT